MPIRNLCLLGLLTLLPTASAHEVLLGARGRLVQLGADGAIEWELPWGGIHDLHVLENGNIMVQRGASEVIELVPSTGKVVWSYDASTANGNAGRPVEVHAFQPLPDGRVMIAESGSARILEVDRRGRIQKEIALELDRPHPHMDTRLARKLESGNYLVAHEGDGVVREYDGTSGEVVWEYDVPLFGREPRGGHGPESFGDKCFAALRLESGNTLISTGNGHSVLEVDPAGEIVWQIGQNDLAGVQLGWVTTLEELPGGNYMIGNCHAGPDQPILIEVNPATKEVVWSLDGHADFGNDVSNSKILGLEPEAELLARAREIHWSTLTLDTHKDISTGLAWEEVPEEEPARTNFLEQSDPRVWGVNQADFPKMNAGGLDVAFFIVYVGQGLLNEEAYEIARNQAMAKFDAIHRMARRFPEDIGLATSADEVVEIAESGRLVACIGIENGYAMGADLSLVETFHERGARYMSITHNRHSQLGDSNIPEEPIHGGLSDLGRRAIEEMNRVGIMVDVSHAAKTTTLQTIEHSVAPCIASHSSVSGVFEHSRNLDDETLKALAARGGVIQIVAFDIYVKDPGERSDRLMALRKELDIPWRRSQLESSENPDDRRRLAEFDRRKAELEAQYPPATVADMIDHVDHAVELVGIDHVAISSDFDGGGGVLGWSDASQTFNLTLEMVRRGYSAEDIAKLWSGNTLRLWREVERVAAELQAR